MNSEKLEGAKTLFFIALSLDLALTATVGLDSYSTIGTLKAIQSGIQRADQALISSMDFGGNLSMLTMLTLIGVGLTLVKWLNTCYRYARSSVGASGFKNENWTASGWIIPIINLFKPYQIISEIYKAGASNYSNADDWKKESGSGILLMWWICYAVTHFIYWIAARQIVQKTSIGDDLTLPQIIGLYDVSVWTCGLSIITSALWFLVANHLTQRLLDRKPLESPSNAKSQLPSHSQALPTTSKSSVEPEFDEYRGNEVTQPAAAPMMKAPELPATTAHEHSSATPMSRKSEAYVPTSPAADLVAMPDGDDWAYEMVAVELDQNNLDKTQWTRAFAETGGDENKTKALYIQRRVQRIVATEAERIREINAQRARELEAEKLRHAQEIAKERQARERERQEKLAAEGHRLQGLKEAREAQERSDAEERKSRSPILQPSPIHATESGSGQTKETPFSVVKILAGVIAFVGILAVIVGNPSTPIGNQTGEPHGSGQNNAYSSGWAAFDRGDFASAINEWKPLAMKGDAIAQTNMGFLYSGGHGVAQDYKQAFDWFSKAGAQGNAKALYSLGYFYERGMGVPQNMAQAFEFYQKSAAKGFANAQIKIGLMYLKKDDSKAFEWFQKAAAQGDAEGQKHLGKMFELGKGVPQDLAKAFEWYQKAAIQGDADAQNDVGWHYEQAIGVSQNLAEAARWYRLAAQQGDPYAQNNLGLMYERGRYFEQNDDEALKWYRLVIAHGDKVDTDRLASHFTRDQLTEKSIQKAGLSVKP